jgi:glyoxylase-like metal-dependent hydrolase (beta-lactamase superfamily II)
MKKGLKRGFLIIGAVLILFLGFALYYYSPALTMNVSENGQIQNTNIYVIKNGMGNLFLIKTDDGYIMIDAGLNSKRLENSLKEAKIDISEINWIFLTHSDSDHTGTLALFPNAHIYMSIDEFPLINGMEKRNIFGGNKMPSGIDIGKINLLVNGQEIWINGVRIECIMAPGHTPGTMLFLIDGKYLFTGDAFKIRHGNISVHPYTMNSTQSKKKKKKLEPIIMGSHIVLTSHYGVHYNTTN